MPVSKYELSKAVVFIPVVAAAYFISAKLGLQLAILNSSTSAIWPPTGIAIAAIILFGDRLWPAVFIGAFLANVTIAGNVLSSVGIALGNTLEAYIAAKLVSKLSHGAYTFEHPRDVITYAFFAGFCATMVSAFIGVTTLSLTGSMSWALYWPVWFTWWLGDMGGALIVAPFFILWYIHRKVDIQVGLLEMATISIAFLYVCYLIFSNLLPAPYLIFPVILWIAFRFGKREVATFSVLLAVIAVAATIHGYGPFVLQSNNINGALILAQLFLSVVAISKLTVAAAISERQQVKETLLHREHRFRALIEKSSDAIAIIDPTSTILYASESSERILGFKPEEMVGQSGLALTHPDDVSRVRKTLQSVLTAPNKFTTMEVQAKKKDNGWVWLEISVRNLLKDPDVSGIVVNYRDISERKRLDEAKDEFLMIAAHQLRTPLGAMRWNLELMLGETELAPALRKKLGAIYTNIKKMIDLVNELLDVSRIMQGKTPNEPAAVDLGAIIDKQIATLGEVAQKNSVDISVSIPEKIPVLYLDPLRITAVFQNLLSNAIKYTPEGGTVTVQILRENRWFHITVSDTGIGIPKEEQNKVFSKFFRAQNARSLHTEGSGLGLFVVKSYVLRWGGRITLESPVGFTGKGTAIHIRLPVSLTRK